MAPASGFGLYLHTPFCRRKCAYCDFNSYAGMEPLIDDYVEAVARQIERISAESAWPEVSGVFFGGGNPALLGADAIGGLLDLCRRDFKIKDGAEISLEMNPEDADRATLGKLKEAGFNRLSLGWQSLNDGRLKLLGRGHDAAQAIASLSEGRAAGFDNINVDLIFGSPGQTAPEWQVELAQAAAERPDHISAYALSVEPGTRLARLIDRGAVGPVDEDIAARMYEITGRALKAAGYAQYEISNYALPGKECRHNLNYWAGGDYLGFGAGAHSHLQGRRWWSVRSLADFIERSRAGSAMEGSENLTRRQRLSERIFLGLRLNEGVDIDDIEAEFGVGLTDIYGDAIAGLEAQGLMKIGRRLALTEKGRLLANEAMSAFI